MAAARWSSLIVAILLLAPSSNALAQNRDRRDDNGGPAFCRSGAGHPQFGWEWCRQRGWDRVNGRGVYRGDNRVYDDRDYRNGRVYRDDRRNDRIYRNGRVNDFAFENGYSDGYEKGLNAGRDRKNFDPTREKWYRSGDRHYDKRYGSKAQYENVYRDGFRSGYQAGYQDGDRRYDNRRTSRRWPY